MTAAAAAVASGWSSAQLCVPPNAAGVAVTPVSVSAGSRGTLIHSSAVAAEADILLSHWVSAVSFAALSSTLDCGITCAASSSSAAGLAPLTGGAASEISVRPALATVGSVCTICWASSLAGVGVEEGSSTSFGLSSTVC